MNQQEMLDADQKIIQYIRTVTAYGADSAVAEGLASGLLARFDPALLMKLFAGHAGAMAVFAGSGDTEAFLDEYEEFATLHRTQWDLDHMGDGDE